MTPGRTVDICGRYSGQTMVAMMLPPKAGRVMSRFREASSMAKAVQSAVRPVAARADTRGARSRPMVVAPKKTMPGLYRSTAAMTALA